MVNLVALSPPLTKKHIPGRPWCSLELNRRSGATVPSRESEIVRSSSFAKKNNEEISDWYHASKCRLFATFASSFSSPRASSRCVPLFRSADCSACADDRSGPGLPIRRRSRRSRIQERLRRDASWKVKAWHRRKRVLTLNVQAKFPEQRHARE